MRQKSQTVTLSSSRLTLVVEFEKPTGVRKMELKGSKTEESLRKAHARELHVKASYEYFAAVAKKTGLEHVADIFQSTSENEAEHARHEFDVLGRGDDIGENLEKLFDERSARYQTRKAQPAK